MKIAVVCAHGVGDAVILQIVAHHLLLQGHDVSLATPHRFGLFFPNIKYVDEPLEAFDAIFLQHDNTPRSRNIHALKKPVYTFYGAYKAEKHGPLRGGLDYVCDHNLSMVDNIVLSLKALFQIEASKENGICPPAHLQHRKHQKRVAIHFGSGDPERNWPYAKFQKVGQWLEEQGYEPFFFSQLPSLEELCTLLYESDFFLGNDSGPGHIASCLQIPSLIIGKESSHMRHWRPDWMRAEVISPPTWLPRKLRKRYWKNIISTKSVINTLKQNVLQTKLILK